MAVEPIPKQARFLAPLRKDCAHPTLPKFSRQTRAPSVGAVCSRFGIYSGVWTPVLAAFRHSLPRKRIASCAESLGKLRKSAGRGVAQPGSASALGAEKRSSRAIDFPVVSSLVALRFGNSSGLSGDHGLTNLILGGMEIALGRANVRMPRQQERDLDPPGARQRRVTIRVEGIAFDPGVLERLA